MATRTIWVDLLYFILIFTLSLCTLTGPYTLLTGPYTLRTLILQHTYKHSLHHLLTCTSYAHTFVVPLHPPTQILSSYTLLLLCLSYILMPSHFTPIHIYLYHSSIPAHCKYGTGSDPVYSMLTLLGSSYFLFLYLVCFCSTLLFFVLNWYWLLHCWG